jgi:hypothetical protein
MGGRFPGVNQRIKATEDFFMKDVAEGMVSTYFHASIVTTIRRFGGETLGVIAQLVERLNGIEEVWGSNPHGSTKRLFSR